ncbi:hypothetical protein [Jannaschia rubra]|uniref:hypothetical protein n=1 Tax=Jannaschia rubra TaxID=282197 RepID=UPI0024904985|nr:hypothetical protein [Jannaschia rubra]
MAGASSPAGTAQGRGPAFKYDLLTALGAHACRSDKHAQRLVLRLMTLVTARYDWRHDRLSTGQREIAALWAVDERTVKREMAKLRERGWLVLRHPAARGRVACYGLGVPAILADTRRAWGAVGPDFEARLAGPVPEGQGANVIPFPEGSGPGGEAAPAGPWGEVAARFRAADAAAHAAWIAPLRFEGVADGVLRLRAPSAFHASFVRTHLAGTLADLARGVASSVEVLA